MELCAVLLEEDPQATGLQHLGCLRTPSRAAQERLDTRQQLADLERLAHIVVRAEHEAVDDVLLRGERRQEQNRDVRMPPNGAAYLAAVEHRQQVVEQD